MSQVFKGQAWLVATPDEPIDVVATIDGGRLQVTSGALEIINWAVDEVDVATRTDGFLLRSHDDELVFSTPRSGFPQALASQRGTPATG